MYVHRFRSQLLNLRQLLLESFLLFLFVHYLSLQSIGLALEGGRERERERGEREEREERGREEREIPSHRTHWTKPHNWNILCIGRGPQLVMSLFKLTLLSLTALSRSRFCCVSSLFRSFVSRTFDMAATSSCLTTSTFSSQPLRSASARFSCACVCACVCVQNVIL